MLPSVHRQLKALTDSDLLSRTESLVREERRITLEFLHHLREIESRMLFARQHSSLFDYLTTGLHYSEGAAHRRIQAMRALRELPELAEDIQEGRLSLTTASQVQVFLKQEAKEVRAYSREEKKELFEKAHGLSRRETEELLVSIAPRLAQPRDRERPIAPGRTQITFTADQELLDLLQRVKELDSHRDPNPDYLSLFKRLAEIALQKLDPARKRVRSKASESPSGLSERGAKSAISVPAREPALSESSEFPEFPELSKFPALPELPTVSLRPTPLAESMKVASVGSSRTRGIPAETFRALWLGDREGCQKMDPVTRRRCGSRFQLQADHIIAFADGGPSTLENLVLHCATHNRLRALERFGKEKMSRYLPTLRG